MPEVPGKQMVYYEPSLWPHHERMRWCVAAGLHAP
jgi:hypothetical protein